MTIWGATCGVPSPPILLPFHFQLLSRVLLRRYTRGMSKLEKRETWAVPLRIPDVLWLWFISSCSCHLLHERLALMESAPVQRWLGHWQLCWHWISEELAKFEMYLFCQWQANEREVKVSYWKQQNNNRVYCFSKWLLTEDTQLCPAKSEHPQGFVQTTTVWI